MSSLESPATRDPASLQVRNTQEAPALSRMRLAVMTVAAGVSIANLYYNQPLLEQMEADLHAQAATAGLVPTLTQLGYALGMLFLVPLGDMLQRRRLVLAFTLFAALACAAVAASPSLPVLLGASFLLGLVNMTPQLLIPFAAQLSPPQERGRVVGLMVSGVLLGVLLSRTVAGFVGATFGWRMMFVLASVLLLAVLGLLFLILPVTSPSYRGRYVSLLASVCQLVVEQPVLREACWFGAMLFGAFMAFWANLIHLLAQPPLHLGAPAVGLYGLLGAGATLAGPLIARVAGRGSARNMAGAMAVLTLVSFVPLWLGGSSLFWIAVGVLGMDLGVQLAHISNQTRIVGLVEGAQSRIQTAYMTCYFAGGGLGAAVGSLAWEHGGWPGVCWSAMLMALLPVIRWLLPLPAAPAKRLPDRLA
jgi:predicted MFS family arabinose efflux permease